MHWHTNEEKRVFVGPQNRKYFVTTDQDPYIVIYNCSTEDAGLYTCCVSYIGYTTYDYQHSSVSIRLNVCGKYFNTQI